MNLRAASLFFAFAFAALAIAAEALAKLLAHSTNLFGPHGELEVPAVPVAVEGDLIFVHPSGCFDSMQHLTGKPQPEGLCVFTGDVLAAAASMYTGVPHSARQLPGKDDGRCVFRLSRGEVPPEFSEVLDTIRSELSAAYRDSALQIQ